MNTGVYDQFTLSLPRLARNRVGAKRINRLSLDRLVWKHRLVSSPKEKLPNPATAVLSTLEVPA